MKILFVILKDIFQIGRDKRSLIFTLLLPIIFTVLMGVIFSQDDVEDERLPVAIAAIETGFAEQQFMQLIEMSETIRPVLTDETDETVLSEQVRDQTYAAVVLINSNLSMELIDGNAIEFILIIDETSLAGQTARRALELAGTRFLGSIQTARRTIDLHSQYGTGIDTKTEFENLIINNIQEWEDPIITVETQPFETGINEVEEFEYDGNAMSSAGMLVFFSSIGMISSGYVLLAERRSGTLQRMISSKISKIEILIGHIMAMFIISFLQILLLTIFGHWVIGVPYWQSPIAVLILTLALALFSACFGLLIGVFSKDENQIVLLVLTITLVFGLMGGTFFPLEMTGESFAALGHLFPSAWAMDGFLSIALRGTGLAGVIQQAGILLAYSVLVFIGAVWKFHAETK